MPPAISTASRTNEKTGVVSFTVPTSDQDVEYFEILLYNATNKSTFDEVYKVYM